MCDDDTHGDLTHDPSVSRRTFALSTAAALALAAAPAYADVSEGDVTVSTPDGSADAALFHPAGPGSWPAVLVWPDILGLRPVFRQMGRRLAAQGYVVLVPNPFYRQKRAPVVDASFDLRKAEDRAKVMPLMAALTPDGTDRDAKAFVAFLDAQPQTQDLGQGRRTRLLHGRPAGLPTRRRPCRRTSAPSRPFTARPSSRRSADSPHLLIPKMKATAYCGVADNDDKREPAAKDALKAGFAEAHLPAQVEVYEGANHGWCVMGNAVYNEAAAERAWADLTMLYKSALV